VAPVAAPPSATTPAAAAGPGPVTSPSVTPAAYATSGWLAHVPRFGPGGDVGFDIPSGRNWNDAASVNNLDDFIPLGKLSGEQTITQWRGFNGSGRVLTYLQVRAIDLATHPDVKTAQDLAALKMRFLCRDVYSCSTAVQPDTTLGTAPGVPAQIVDSTMVRHLGEVKPLSGLTTDEGNVTGDQLTWKMRDVFVVKGNYGYDIRLAQTDSNLSTERLAELAQMLATLTFRY
jgi:hypothetical protein